MRDFQDCHISKGRLGFVPSEVEILITCGPPVALKRQLCHRVNIVLRGLGRILRGWGGGERWGEQRNFL